MLCENAGLNIQWETAKLPRDQMPYMDWSIFCNAKTSYNIVLHKLHVDFQNCSTKQEMVSLNCVYMYLSLQATREHNIDVILTHEVRKPADNCNCLKCNNYFEYVKPLNQACMTHRHK